MVEPIRIDNHTPVTTQHIIIHTAQQQAAAVTSSNCKQQVLDELDDPNELWKRPYSM